MAMLSISIILCRACNAEKPIGEFYKHLNRHGAEYADNTCKACRKQRAKNRKFQAKTTNPELIEKQREWRRNHKKALRSGEWVPRAKRELVKQKKLIKRTTIDIAKAQQDAHVKVWRRRMTVRALNKKYRSEPVGKIHNRISVSVRAMITKGRGKSWQSVLGYTAQDLKTHLERQFKKGMGWHNMDEWQIDHIVPRVAFRDANVDDLISHCWSLHNLRPLWKDENLAKRGHRLHLL